MGIDDFQFRQSETVGHTSSRSSSLTRRSISLSSAFHPQDNDDLESESVSEAGDIGDRALHSNRSSGSGRLKLSIDNVIETGTVVPIAEDALLQSFRFRPQDPNLSSTVSPVLPLPQEITASLSTYNIASSSDQNLDISEKKLPWLVEYVSCLIQLAAFGILGVLTRYLLQKLFGPSVIGATSDQSYMYLDLPSNMVGSFLMGWFGVVFKQDIFSFSEPFVIGLTTGYLGSLTTFSGWNQKMIELSVEGHWVFAILGCLIGLFLVAYSIIFGVETAVGFRWLLRRFNSKINLKVDKHKIQLALMVVFLVILATLWGLSGSLERNKFHNGGNGAQLWLACLVGPLGVWIRWFLARLNGRGLGKADWLKWVPFGTLIANVSAACIMAALAVVKEAVKTKNCDTIVTGLQFGLLGCLSTVSTFMAEFYAMRQSKHPWRAYAYAMATILISFSLGTLIYSVPVWTKGYD